MIIFARLFNSKMIIFARLFNSKIIRRNTNIIL